MPKKRASLHQSTHKKKKNNPASKSLSWLAFGLCLLIIGILYIYLRPKPIQVAEVNTAPEETKPLMWFMVTTKATYNRQLPNDYKRLFTNPEEWSRSRTLMDTFFFGWSQRDSEIFEPQFLKNNVIPVLKASNVKIGFDSGFATWLSCRRAQGDRNLQYDLDHIRRVHEAGGEVSYIRLQSTLAKAVPDNLKDTCPTYTVDQRIADMRRYMQTIHAQYPNIKIGLVDATASHIIRGQRNPDEGYEKLFTKTQTELAKSGEKLEFIVVDTSTENSMGLDHPGILEYPQLLELERFVQKKLGVKFGIIVVSSEGGMNDEKLFFDNSLKFVREYYRLGGRPDIYFPESWHRYPWKALPEDSKTSQPMTNVFLRIALFLNKQEY
jgi:hypothetical protein